MAIGMLWFNDKRSLKPIDAILAGRNYYQTKYGKTPNIVYVHPRSIPQNKAKKIAFYEQVRELGMVLQVSTTTQNNHYWFGVDPNLERPKLLNSIGM